MFMRLSSVFLPVLLVAVASAHGQALEPRNSVEAEHPIAAASHGLPIEGCPVGLLADRRSDMAMVRVGETHENGPAQGLHISLIHFVTPKIESAEVTVYGVTTRASVLPVGVASDEISKTFSVHPRDGNKGFQDATVWMYQVGALTRVELKSLTYADGSVWHESEGSRCRAVPNPFLLVGER
jgi:hypothetical protein